MSYAKYCRAIRNQERLEHICWRAFPVGLVSGRKMNARQRRRFKYWGYVAAKNFHLEANGEKLRKESGV